MAKNTHALTTEIASKILPNRREGSGASSEISLKMKNI